VAEKLVLYNYWRSSSSYRVRVALRLKGLEFEYRPIHLLKEGGQQNKDDFRALNPKGEVPFLLHGQFGLGQSMAILDYLEAIQPTPELRPQEAQARARCLEICEIINSGMQPLHNLRVLQKLEHDARYSEEQKKEWIQFWIRSGLDALEVRVSGPYALGDRLSWADVCLIPQIYSAKRFGIELSAYPKLSKINEGCLKLPAFFESAPEKQIDAAS
jgi:maleylacetoacetate isomerase